MPDLEKPYEKLEKYGANMLSDAELLAIILKTGNKNESSVILAQKILKNNPYSHYGLRFTHHISINELMKFKGIGKVKAITLLAVGEIIKRAEIPLDKELKIQTSKDAANVLMPKIRYEPQETFCVLLLDTKCYLKKIEYIATGDSNSVNLIIANVFKEAIKQDVNRIIIAHNHPSGNPNPSKSDILFTKEIINAGNILGIEVIDHIIIGDGEYKSIINI